MRKYLWLILCLALLLSACAKKEAAPNAVVTEPTGPVQQELTTQQRLDAIHQTELQLTASALATESQYSILFSASPGNAYKTVVTDLDGDGTVEDSEYYSEAQADMIRAIVTNAYPYVSVEEMKASLKTAGFKYADALTRNEIISAVQAAIWASANGKTAQDLRYAKSYKVSDNLQWGYPLHDTSAESGLDVSGKRVFKTYEEDNIKNQNDLFSVETYILKKFSI